MRIRSGRGLGDTIYLRPIVEHFVREGKNVVALCDYPEIISGTGAKVEPFVRNGCDVVAHYVNGKTNPETTQWHDMCAAAGVAPLDLSFDWKILNPALIERVQASAGGRPIVLVHGGREPYGRQDGFGRELIPRRDAFVSVLELLAGCYRVLIGKDFPIYPLDDFVDLNLSGNTSVYDLLDLGRSCNAVVAQCSFAVPLAEVFNKPLLAIWSEQGLKSKDNYISATTPKKILSKTTSRYIMDSWQPAKIEREVDAIRRVI